MLTFVIVLQVLVALFLIMVILLQPGNKGGASAALGGAGSDTVFGARGANTFLSKITFGAAVCFMLTNILLSFLSSPSGNSEVIKALENMNKTQPAAGTQEAQPVSDTPGSEEAPASDAAKPAVPAAQDQAQPIENNAAKEEAPKDTQK